jgi:hypothetical protein
MAKGLVLQGTIAHKMPQGFCVRAVRAHFVRASAMLSHCPVRQGHTIPALPKRIALFVPLASCVQLMGFKCLSSARLVTCATLKGRRHGQNNVLLVISAQKVPSQRILTPLCPRVQKLALLAHIVSRVWRQTSPPAPALMPRKSALREHIVSGQQGLLEALRRVRLVSIALLVCPALELLILATTSDGKALCSRHPASRVPTRLCPPLLSVCLVLRGSSAKTRAQQCLAQRTLLDAMVRLTLPLQRRSCAGKGSIAGL